MAKIRASLEAKAYKLEPPSVVGSEGRVKSSKERVKHVVALHYVV